jgi:hypothetical protein
MPRIELAIVTRFQRGGVPVILASISDNATVRAAIETAIASAGRERASIARQQEIRLLGELLGQMDQKPV